MRSAPSSTYQRLRHFIAQRMRMSHIDQRLCFALRTSQGSQETQQEVLVLRCHALSPSD